MKITEMFPDLRRIYVNPIIGQQMIGKSEYYLTHVDNYYYKVGERVLVIAKELGTGEVTGLWFIRYVKEAVYIPSHENDDCFTQLLLGAYDSIRVELSK